MTHANLIEKMTDGIYGEMDRRYNFAISHTQGQRDKFRIYTESLAKAALTAIEEAGFVVVPRKPTPEMVQAGSQQWHSSPAEKDGTWGIARNTYAAMIAQAEKEWRG